MSMGLVISDKGVDRRNILYNKKGHRSIQIKRVRKPAMPFDRNRTEVVDNRIERLYSRYDSLVSIEFKNLKIMHTIMHLLRYFNSGNSDTI